MGERCLLMIAKRGQKPIAGSLHMIGGDCLYGRYWGAIEHHPCLHFELCYYQAIEYAIQHKIARVEAGAQGEHKLARGYLPTKTYSAHYIADPSLRRAIADYLVRERAYVDAASEELTRVRPVSQGARSGVTRGRVRDEAAEPQRQLPDADEIHHPAGDEKHEQRRGYQCIAALGLA